MLSKNKNIWGGIYVATICPMDENGGINEDELSNALIGLKIIHDFRNEKLFSIFEDLVRTKQFIDTETYVKKEETDVKL